MQHPKAVMIILDVIIERSENPYLRSYKALPVNVLYKILDEFIKEHEIQIIDKEFRIVFDVEKLAKRVEGALNRYVLRDEVGMLIKHNASKTTIREITGINNNEIVDRRKRMGAAVSSFGRPRILDPKQKELIKNMWTEQDLSPAMKAISIGLHTGLRVDDVWNTVSNKSAEKQKEGNRVSQFN